MKLYAEAGRIVWCSLDLPQTNTRRACKVKEKGINEMRSKGIWIFMTKEETVSWGGKTGGQLGLDPGPGNETAKEVRLWAQHVEAAGVEAVEEARRKEEEGSERGGGGRFKGEYGLPAEQERALKVLMRDPRKFALTTADKGGGVILISNAREAEESRKHVLDESAYKPLKHFTDGIRWSVGE